MRTPSIPADARRNRHQCDEPSASARKLGHGQQALKFNFDTALESLLVGCVGMGLNSRVRNPILMALDVPTGEEAWKLVEQLAPIAGGFKVGSELFTSAGPEIVRKIRGLGAPVFLDLKFHDIPNTVGSACEAAARLGVFMMNVHALGGKNIFGTQNVDDVPRLG